MIHQILSAAELLQKRTQLNDELQKVNSAIAAKNKKDANPDEDDDEEDEEDDEKEKVKPESLTQLTALVPEGQHFEAKSMNNEGIWLTVAHINAIELALKQRKKSESKMQKALAENAEEITRLSGMVLTLTNVNKRHEEKIKKLSKEDGTPGENASGREDANVQKITGNITSKQELAMAKTCWDIEIGN